MAQLRAHFLETLQVKEEQEEVLHHLERELIALKGALKEEVESHDQYMAALKEEYEQELQKLLGDLDLAKEVTCRMQYLLTCLLFHLWGSSFISPIGVLEQRRAVSREGGGGGGERRGQGAAEGAEPRARAAEGKGAGAQQESGSAGPGDPGGSHHREAAGAESEAAGGGEEVFR